MRMIRFKASIPGDKAAETKAPKQKTAAEPDTEFSAGAEAPAAKGKKDGGKKTGLTRKTPMKR